MTCAHAPHTAHTAPTPPPKNVPDRFQPLAGPFDKPTIGIRSHRDYLIFTSGPKNADPYDIYHVFLNFQCFSSFSFGAIFGKLQGLLWFHLKCLIFQQLKITSNRSRNIGSGLYSGGFGLHPPRKVNATAASFSSNCQTATQIRTNPSKKCSGEHFSTFPIPPASSAAPGREAPGPSGG